MNVIKGAIRARRMELELYEINIYNYEHAAIEIGANRDLQEFKKALLDLAAKDRAELQKSNIILRALEAQRLHRTNYLIRMWYRVGRWLSTTAHV